jgi:hypothetical protein
MKIRATWGLGLEPLVQSAAAMGNLIHRMVGFVQG